MKLLKFIFILLLLCFLIDSIRIAFKVLLCIILVKLILGVLDE